MANHYLGSMRKFGHKSIFIGKPIKIPPDSLYEGHILGFVGVNIWHTHLILFKLGLPILDVDNVVPVPAIIGDAETHIFKFWDSEDIRNRLLVEQTLNGT